MLIGMKMLNGIGMLIGKMLNIITMSVMIMMIRKKSLKLNPRICESQTPSLLFVSPRRDVHVKDG